MHISIITYNSKQILIQTVMLPLKLKLSLQGVDSIGGHFACLCQRFDFYEVFFFQYEKGYTFTLLIIFIVKSLQKEQNRPNLLL